MDAKNQFKWYATFDELVSLAKTLLEVSEDGEVSEDPSHKMFPFKIENVIVKWYSSTNTIQIQGSGFAFLQEN